MQFQVAALSTVLGAVVVHWGVQVAVGVDQVPVGDWQVRTSEPAVSK